MSADGAPRSRASNRDSNDCSSSNLVQNDEAGVAHKDVANEAEWSLDSMVAGPFRCKVESAPIRMSREVLKCGTKAWTTATKVANWMNRRESEGIDDMMNDEWMNQGLPGLWSGWGCSLILEVTPIDWWGTPDVWSLAFQSCWNFEDTSPIFCRNDLWWVKKNAFFVLMRDGFVPRTPTSTQTTTSCFTDIISSSALFVSKM